MPTGTACPLKGDVDSAGCSPGLPSYTDAGCVAPVDAECAQFSGTSWGCIFPDESSSSSLSSASGSGSGYESAEVVFPAGKQGHDDEVTFPPATQGATQYMPSKGGMTNDATTSSSAQQGGKGKTAYASDTKATTGTSSPTPRLRSEYGSATGTTGGYSTQSPNQHYDSAGKTTKTTNQGPYQSQIVQSGDTVNDKSSYQNQVSQASNTVGNGENMDSYQYETIQSTKDDERSSYKSTYEQQSSKASGVDDNHDSYDAYPAKSGKSGVADGSHDTYGVYPAKSSSVVDDSHDSYDAYPAKSGKGGKNQNVDSSENNHHTYASKPGKSGNHNAQDGRYKQATPCPGGSSGESSSMNYPVESEDSNDSTSTAKTPTTQPPAYGDTEDSTDRKEGK